jgi:hypothetical protein
MKALLRKPLLRGDKYLMYFLTESNKDRWKKCIGEMKKEARIAHVSQIVTAQGFVDFVGKENEVRQVEQDQAKSVSRDAF